MKRILKLFTSRLVQTGVSLLVQIAIICIINLYVSNIFVYYYLICLVLGLLFTVLVINSKTNAGYKIAWIILLLGVPVFGVSLYVTLSGRILTRLNKRKMLKITHSIKDKLHSSIEIKDKSIRKQSEYITSFSYSPPVKNTDSKYFDSGQAFFESLLEDIKSAKETIYLEFFIISTGYLWEKIKNQLILKAKQGVDVRIIYDDMGCLDKLSKKEIDRLKEEGIRIKPFNLFLPVLDLAINNRDHRKICVLDSRVAYTGGINIGDEYVNKKERFGYWKDSGMALYGEGAYSFYVFFLSMWEHITKERASYQKPTYKETDNGVFQPYVDSPIDYEPLGENVYINMISNAKSSVYISTPYFVVDDEMLRAITNAAKGGIDVKIILPGIPDKKIVNQVTKSYYQRLIESGVKVYEYKKGFNHSKIVIIDEELATIGSVNFDYRSFYLSFECGVLIYKSNVINDVLLDYNTMLTESTQISIEDARSPLITRIFRAILQAISPML